MPLPPKDDPRRPLHLAVRLMRLLGGILLLFSTCLVMRVVTVTVSGGFYVAWRAIAVVLLYLLPGAGFILLSVYVDKRERWAVIAATCVASVIALFLGLSLLGLSLFALRGGGTIILVPISILLLLLLAISQLIYSLSRSFESIRLPAQLERGFEPIMVTPLPASEMYPQQHERRDEPAGP